MYLLGVRIDNVTMTEALQRIQGFLEDGGQHYVVTPNPEFLVLAQKDREFREILNRADLAIPDGIGLVWASRLMDEALKGRVTGVDLIEKIKEGCVIARRSVSDDEAIPWKTVDASNSPGLPRSPVVAGSLAMTDVRIFLLGGRDGVAEKIATQWLQVVGFTEETEVAVNLINQCQANLLLVALGAPRQEKWITQNLSKVPSVKIAIGVGGAFDFLAGRIRRAPKFLQKMGLEWLWRLAQEPYRLPRIIKATVKFLLLVLGSKIRASR